MSDEPKSAVELAMERLRARDREQGTEPRPLTNEQREAIAELRQIYEAKLAEVEILHRSRMRRAEDPGEREALEAEYRRDRERIGAERDAKIEKRRTEA